MKAFYSHISAVAENNTIGFKGQLPLAHTRRPKVFFIKKPVAGHLSWGEKPLNP